MSKMQNDNCVEAPVNICKPISMCKGNGRISVRNKELIANVYGTD